jgi:hypothetical protein
MGIEKEKPVVSGMTHPFAVGSPGAALAGEFLDAVESVGAAAVPVVVIVAAGRHLGLLCLIGWVTAGMA